MRKTASQKDNSLGLSLLHHFNGHIHFIFSLLHTAEEKRIPFLLNLFLKDSDHTAEKWIVNSLNQKHNHPGD